jgi:nitroreductase
MASAGRLSMSLGEAIFTQRAIRRLRPEPIPDADLQTILAAGARAPSGGNIRPWRFVVVRDQALKDRLADYYVDSYWHRRRLRGFAGPEAIPKHDSSGQAALYLSTNASHYASAPVLLLVICVNHTNDVMTACQNLMLAARALGIGSTITRIGEPNEAKVHDLLGIPPEMEAGTCIPLGYPEGHFGDAARKSLLEIAFLDRYGAPGPWTSTS